MNIWYTRVLNREELQVIWEQVEERWYTIDDYWYPLVPDVCPADVIAFDSDQFRAAIPLNALHNILKKHNISCVWEIAEGAMHGWEMDCDMFDPEYTGDEGYWTSEGYDWLVYASHERSMTVAGEWLIAEIKQIWVDWKQHLYQEKKYF